MSTLTPRQRRILDFIREYVADRGYSPTLQEIADGTGLAAKSAAAYQLAHLTAGGYVTRHPGSSRTIVLLDEPEPSS